jgi:hypothetical protein
MAGHSVDAHIDWPKRGIDRSARVAGAEEGGMRRCGSKGKTEIGARRCKTTKLAKCKIASDKSVMWRRHVRVEGSVGSMVGVIKTSAAHRARVN